MRFEKKHKKKVKCKRCGESKEVIKDTLKNVNICEDCLNNYKKAQITCSHCHTKFKREESWYEEGLATPNLDFCSETCHRNYYIDTKERDKMDLWLKEYFKVEKLPVLIYQQMGDFKNKKGISYTWCFATLRYMVDIKSITLREGSIALVPYYYDECKKYAMELNRIKKMAEDGDRAMSEYTDHLVIIPNSNINKVRESQISKKTIREEDLEGVMEW